MTWLALFLLGIGLADIVAAARPDLPTSSGPARWLPAAIGGAAAVLLGALAGFATVPDWVALAVIVAAIVGWRALLPDGERDSSYARRTLAGIILPSVALIALSGYASPVRGPLAQWLAWIDFPALASFTAERALLLAALVLVNTMTANQIVRLVLVSVNARPPRRGAPPPAEPLLAPPSEKLRGGRLLGPMERLLVIGFGAAGYLEAAGIVVAAKGLLRFPELQAAARSDETSVDEVTEYFLVGTFTSLLVALASVVLLA